MSKQPLQNEKHHNYTEKVRAGLKSVVAQIISEMRPLREMNEGQTSRESMAKNKPNK